MMLSWKHSSVETAKSDMIYLCDRDFIWKKLDKVDDVLDA